MLSLGAPVKAVDKTALVKLLDKASVYEILRFGRAGLGVFERELVKYGFDPFQRRVLLPRQFIFRDRIVEGFFQDLAVVGVQVLGQDF